MLKKDSSGPRQVSTEEVHTILGPESSFNGTLSFDGALRVDGKFTGEIQTKDVLIVGQQAQVSAEIEVGTLVINGEVHGNIRAHEGVELHAPAKLFGNIETPSLIIDKGVLFDGNCKMTNLGESKVLSMKKDIGVDAHAAAKIEASKAK